MIAIGALGLLIGWLIELMTKYRSFSFSIGFDFNMLDRWVLFLTNHEVLIIKWSHIRYLFILLYGTHATESLVCLN